MVSWNFWGVPGDAMTRTAKVRMIPVAIPTIPINIQRAVMGDWFATDDQRERSMGNFGRSGKPRTVRDAKRTPIAAIG